MAYEQNLKLSANEKARCNTLTTLLQEMILQQNHSISFAQFMDTALYYPEFGYYQSPNFTLGKTGDFTTAPQISPLFAQCIAKQTTEVFEAIAHKNFLELGPGTGQFAADLIDYLVITQSLPERYFLFEVSETLQKIQQTLIKKRHPELFHRFQWLNTLPTQFNGVIFGNEVLDAMPVHRIMLDNDQIFELNVALEQGEFTFQPMPASKEIATAIANIPSLANIKHQYISEINLNTYPYILNLAQILNSGLILISDYGYGQPLYYHPERDQGTLTCFFRHQKNSNPLMLPGLQDITAHVDFTQVATAAMDANAEIAGFCTQANFLLASQLIDLANNMTINMNEKNRFATNQAIKTLTLPSEMGEIIKFMGISKNLPITLSGFNFASRIHELG